MNYNEIISSNPNFGENWFTYPNLYSEMVKKFDSGSHFVELGSWKGRSVVYMAVEIINSGKQIRFDSIDRWQTEPEWQMSGDEVYATFLDNIKPVRSAVNVIRKDSSTAAADYSDGSLDFVFIDADHTYEGVSKDIKAWLPKVKNGGILAGHDYAWFPPIREAVKDIFGPGDYSDPWGNGCFWTQVRRA